MPGSGYLMPVVANEITFSQVICFFIFMYILIIYSFFSCCHAPLVDEYKDAVRYRLHATN